MIRQLSQNTISRRRHRRRRQRDRRRGVDGRAGRPQILGGWGTGFARQADLNLARQAAREDWPVDAAVGAMVVADVLAVTETGTPRQQIAAARTLLVLEAANIRAGRREATQREADEAHRHDAAAVTAIGELRLLVSHYDSNSALEVQGSQPSTPARCEVRGDLPGRLEQ